MGIGALFIARPDGRTDGWMDGWIIDRSMVARPDGGCWMMARPDGNVRLYIDQLNYFVENRGFNALFNHYNFTNDSTRRKFIFY